MPYKDIEVRKAYEKDYREKNKEKKKSYDKNYRIENNDKLKIKDKEYYLVNAESKKNYGKAYYEENKEERRSYEKQYREENTEKINQYRKERKKKEPAYRFIVTLRTRQNSVLKGKMSTTEGLGCNRDFLLEHLSSKFTERMTLENHGWGEGKWHIDHIFPLSSYEEDENRDWKVDSEYNKLLIHFTNLQPLWHEDNLEKSDKVI
jgi:hypothetical protein